MIHPRFAALMTLLLASVPRITLGADPVAEALYQEGRRAAKAHDWTLACKKFQESHDREPAPGTLLNLADCEENRGKLVDALAHFEAASSLFRDDRAAYATQRGEAVERRIPKLTLRLDPTSPIGTAVERDEMPVPTGALGTPVRVDPGEHTFSVRAPGRLAVRGAIRLAEGESREVELSVGPPAPAAQNVEPPAPAVPTVRRDPPPAPPPQKLASAEPPGDATLARASPMRTAAFIGFGVGAGAIGLGVVAGILTLNAKNTASAHCPAAGCDGAGLSAESQGKTWSGVSTASFIAAGVALTAGVAFWLARPKHGPTSAWTALPLPGGAELRWVASF